MENIQYKSRERLSINVILARQLLLLRRKAPLSGLEIYNNGNWHPEVTSRIWLEDFMTENNLTKATLYDTVMPHSIEFDEPKSWFYIDKSIAKYTNNSGNGRKYLRKNINYTDDVPANMKSSGHLILEQGTILVCT